VLSCHEHPVSASASSAAMMPREPAHRHWRARVIAAVEPRLTSTRSQCADG